MNDFYRAPLICPISVNHVQTAAASKNGFLEFDFILTTSGTNQNGQTFLDEDLRRPEVYNYVIGQPIDCDHLEGFLNVRGEIQTAVYCPETASFPSCIRCKGVIFEFIGGHFAEVAELVRLGAGKWAAVSMEAIPRPLRKIGGTRKVIIHDPMFIGAGLVRRPGNKLSQIENLEGEVVPQHIQPTDRTPDHRLVARQMYRLDGGDIAVAAIPPKAIGVASVAVILGGDKILMGRRRDNGKWTMPGGHLDPGETPTAGAQRELKEEAGLWVPGWEFQKLAVEDVDCEDGVRRRIFAFRVDIPQQLTASIHGDPDKEISQWSWIPFSKIPPAESLHSPKNVVLKALGLQTGAQSINSIAQITSEGMRLLTAKRVIR